MKTVVSNVGAWSTRINVIKPAKGYIKLKKKTAHMQCLVDVEIKRRAKVWADGMGSSMNRFVEASMEFYMEALEKEKKNGS